MNGNKMFEKINAMMNVLVICTLLQAIGCTSYNFSMTSEERVIARYEQNCGVEHLCKHIFVDLLTLGFGEIWYHRVRTTYDDVMEARQRAEEEERRWWQFVSSYEGRSKSEIIQGFGVPDKEISDGESGVVLMYESSVRKGWMASYGSAQDFGYGQATIYGNASWRDNAYVTQVWFMIGADGKCKTVKRKRLTRAGGH